MARTSRTSCGCRCGAERHRNESIACDRPRIAARHTEYGCRAVRASHGWRFPRDMERRVPQAHHHGVDALVLRAARVLRADFMAWRTDAAIGPHRDEVGVLHGAHLARRDPGLSLRRLARRAMGPQADLRCIAHGWCRHGLSVWASCLARRRSHARDQQRSCDAVLSVRHVGGALYLYAGALRHRCARDRIGICIGYRPNRFADRAVFGRARVAGLRSGGVFTLGALSFVLAAVAVAVLGIETKGRALESLSSDVGGETDAAYAASTERVRGG